MSSLRRSPAVTPRDLWKVTHCAAHGDGGDSTRVLGLSSCGTGPPSGSQPRASLRHGPVWSRLVCTRSSSPTSDHSILSPCAWFVSFDLHPTILMSILLDILSVPRTRPLRHAKWRQVAQTRPRFWRIHGSMEETEVSPETTVPSGSPERVANRARRDNGSSAVLGWGRHHSTGDI